jgi:hypothetical protein
MTSMERSTAHATSITAGLRDAAREPKTSARQLRTVVKKHDGLTIKVPISHVRVPVKARVCSILHPVIKMSDWSQYLLSDDVRSKLLLGGHSICNTDGWQNLFAEYWENFKRINPSHPVFDKPSHTLRHCIPCSIHGDEGRGPAKAPVLCFNFQPLHAVKGHIFRSRFLTTLMPATWYKKNDETMDSLLAHIARDGRKLFHVGVTVGEHTFYIIIVAVKGDWPFLAKALHLSRHFGCKLICHLCDATSIGNMVSIFGNPTVAEVCKRILSALLTIPGVTPKSGKPDLAHVGHLGNFKDFAGSAVVAGMWLGVWGPGSVPLLMYRAYDDLKAWCRVQRLTLNMNKFTRDRLHLKRNACFPFMGGKGSDIAIILRWIEAKFCGHGDQYLQCVYSSARAINCFFRQLYLSYAQGLWIERGLAKMMVEAGVTYVRGYLFLAHRAHALGWSLFALKPKIHLLCHVLKQMQFELDLGNAHVASPVADMCWGDEDFIGKICRLCRRTHPWTLPRETIDRYLMECVRQWGFC